MKVLVEAPTDATDATDEVARTDQHYMPRLPWAVVVLADALALLARTEYVGATVLFIVGAFWVWVAGCLACWAMKRHPHRYLLVVVPPLLIVLGVVLVVHQTNPATSSGRTELTQPR